MLKDLGKPSQPHGHVVIHWIALTLSFFPAILSEESTFRKTLIRKSSGHKQVKIWNPGNNCHGSVVKSFKWNIGKYRRAVIGSFN